MKERSTQGRKISRGIRFPLSTDERVKALPSLKETLEAENASRPVKFERRPLFLVCTINSYDVLEATSTENAQLQYFTTSSGRQICGRFVFEFVATDCTSKKNHRSVDSSTQIIHKTVDRSTWQEARA